MISLNTIHTLTSGRVTIHPESVQVKAGVKVNLTYALDRLAYSHIQGSNPTEVTVTGRLCADELGFYKGFIAALAGGLTCDFTLDGTLFENYILLEGTAELKKGSLLGEYRLHFGGNAE